MTYDYQSPLRFYALPKQTYGGLTRAQWAPVIVAWLIAWAFVGWQVSVAISDAPDSRSAGTVHPHEHGERP